MHFWQTKAQPGGETVLSTGLSRNLTFTDNGATSNGELVINGSGGSLEPGAGKLFTLQFEVAANVPRKTTLGVIISGATMRDLNGNALVVEILPQDPTESDDTFIEGDLNGDGAVTNADKDLLLEYAFGGNPKVADAHERRIQAGRVEVNGQDFLSVGFYRRLGDASLLFRVQESADFGVWNNLNLPQQIIGTPQNMDDGTERVKVRGTLPVNGPDPAPKGFQRVTVEKP